MFKTHYEKDKISGHMYTIHGPTYGYMVSGNRWCSQVFKTYKAAQKEKELRDAFDKKFPYKWKTTKRERRACKHLGLKLKTGPVVD